MRVSYFHQCGQSAYFSTIRGMLWSVYIWVTCLLLGRTWWPDQMFHQRPFIYTCHRQHSKPGRLVVVGRNPLWPHSARPSTFPHVDHYPHSVTTGNLTKHISGLWCVRGQINHILNLSSKLNSHCAVGSAVVTSEGRLEPEIRGPLDLIHHREQKAKTNQVPRVKF